MSLIKGRLSGTLNVQLASYLLDEDQRGLLTVFQVQLISDGRRTSVKLMEKVKLFCRKACKNNCRFL